MMEGRKSDSGEATKRQKKKYERKKSVAIFHVVLVVLCLRTGVRQVRERQREREETALSFLMTQMISVFMLHTGVRVCV